MANYRMIASVPEHGDLEARLNEQVYSWVRHKGMDADSMEPGAITDLGRAQAVWLIDDQTDGTRVVRFRLREQSGWLTTLTAEIPNRPRSCGRVWLEVEPPTTDDFAAVPKLARNLLVCVPAFDGQARVSDGPVTMTEDDIGELIDVLCDPDRRGIAFVAGTEPGRPLDQWRTHVRDVLHDTVGAASGYVLDASATARLQEEWGERYAAPGGTIRSYRPEVDPASYVDARRHRVLGHSRLQTDRAHYLARMLGYAAREQQHSQPLPSHLTRLATRLARAENQLLASSAVAAAGAPPAQRAASTGSAAPQEPEAVANEPTVVETLEPRIVPPAYAPALADAAVELVGTSLTTEAVDRLVSLARRGRAAEAHLPALQARLDELTEEVEEVISERDHWFREAEDLELELAELAEHASGQDDLVQFLQRNLQQVGQAEVAWSGVPEVDRRRIPDNYEQMLEWMSQLPHIVFTGDPDTTLELADHDPLGRWARNTWEALLALNGYAEAKSKGFRGNFTNYLQSRDVVGPKIAASRYRPVESETVANNQRWRSERTFPVPPDIAASGAVFMQAHIAIVLKRTTSPRLHFCDATAPTARCTWATSAST